LALNVAATRLILLNGFAGKVINAFGTFVVGGNYVLGFVIFLILIIIQFVVITNPTELAIAVRYDTKEKMAPYVVAKGARLVAARIRELAKQHEVPIVENKPLAQLLFKSVEVGMEVPANFYRAVAEILAYVYRLKGKVKAS
jgi:flagellar biosynthesis protein FlhB